MTMSREERISFHKIILWDQIKYNLQIIKNLNGQYLATDNEGAKKLTKFKMEAEVFVKKVESEGLHE